MPISWGGARGVNVGIYGIQWSVWDGSYLRSRSTSLGTRSLGPHSVLQRKVKHVVSAIPVDSVATIDGGAFEEQTHRPAWWFKQV